MNSPFSVKTKKCKKMNSPDMKGHTYDVKQLILTNRYYELSICLLHAKYGICLLQPFNFENNCIIEV